MDISSKYSYMQLDSPEIRKSGLDINGRLFQVLDAVHDDETGLDAYTLKNKASGELTVTYVGTKGFTDIVTDVQLISSQTPEQYKQAEEYLHTVQRKYGIVRSVCGNSLGGGLAAYVAARNPYLEAVTVNPAPVPDELANAVGRNITNYILTKHDVLHRAVIAGGLGNRIIGKVTSVAGTRHNWRYATANHVGSDRDDGPYNASMSVPFSLFYADTVVGGGNFGDKIDVTTENLDLIVTGLKLQRESLNKVIEAELVNRAAKLAEYPLKFKNREAAVKTVFEALMDQAVTPIRARLRALQSGISRTRNAVERLNPPGPLGPAWLDIGTKILRATDKVAAGLEEIIDFQITATAAWLWESIEYTLFFGSEYITTELIAACQTLKKDFELVDDKWETFTQYVAAASEAIQLIDSSVAAAIAARVSPKDAISVSVPLWCTEPVKPLAGIANTKFVQWVINTREMIVSEFAKHLAALITREIVERLHVALVWAILNIEKLEEVFRGASSDLHAASSESVLGPLAFSEESPVDLLRFQGEVKAAYQEHKSESDLSLREIAKVFETVNRLPDVVSELMPSLTDALLSDSEIEDAYNSFTKCLNLVDRSKVSFAEVKYQLEEHSSQAISAIAARASTLRQDLLTVRQSLSEMIG